MKILVVEDETRVATYLKKGLELKSYIVDVAHDGESGFDLAMGETYDLLILDWMLPKMNGLDICKALREENISTPVLMLTAKNEIEDKVQGLDSGADDYLGKPFAFVELLARVRALTRRPKNKPQTKLSIDDLILDTTNYSVSRQDTPINLSKKEFQLLEFFMRHVGQVLHRDQIVEQVWSYDSDVLPNTAQVYVGYLRTKLDKAFPEATPLIHTVRGFGYKFGS